MAGHQACSRRTGGPKSAEWSPGDEWPQGDLWSHHEVLFIRAHQAFEVWFAVFLHEIDQVLRFPDQPARRKEHWIDRPCHGKDLKSSRRRATEDAGASDNLLVMEAPVAAATLRSQTIVQCDNGGSELELAARLARSAAS